MTKRTLDTWGGVGSLLMGLACVWFAVQHHPHESIFKVWVAMCVLLVLNGVAMIVHAQRSPRPEQMTGHTGRVGHAGH